MVVELRNWSIFIVTCLTAATSLPRAFSEDPESVRRHQRLREDQALAASRVASVIGLGQLPILVDWLDVSRPIPTQNGIVFEMSPAAKLDLSPWLIEDRAKMATLAENSSEYTACNYVLVKAHQTLLEALALGARRDLTFAHLLEEPAKYRGEIVHVEGRIMRIRRFDAPALAVKEGVRDFFEGWMFDEKAYGAYPMCLVFSELPYGVKVGEKVNYPAEFDGYFFKRYRYETANGRWKDAPLLIGRAPVVVSPPAAAEEGPSTSLVTAFLGLLAGTLLLALGLAWWYQRGDRQIRARLDAARSRTFVDPSGAE